MFALVLPIKILAFHFILDYTWGFSVVLSSIFVVICHFRLLHIFPVHLIMLRVTYIRSAGSSYEIKKNIEANFILLWNWSRTRCRRKKNNKFLSSSFAILMLFVCLFIHFIHIVLLYFRKFSNLKIKQSMALRFFSYSSLFCMEKKKK